MKTKVYKLETGRGGIYRGDAGIILIVVYVSVILSFFLLGSLSFL
jgi:hypothetical protein